MFFGTQLTKGGALLKRVKFSLVALLVLELLAGSGSAQSNPVTKSDESPLGIEAAQAAARDGIKRSPEYLKALSDLEKAQEELDHGKPDDLQGRTKAATEKLRARIILSRLEERASWASNVVDAQPAGENRERAFGLSNMPSNPDSQPAARYGGLPSSDDHYARYVERSTPLINALRRVEALTAKLPEELASQDGLRRISEEMEPLCKDAVAEVIAIEKNDRWTDADRHRRATYDMQVAVAGLHVAGEFLKDWNRLNHDREFARSLTPQKQQEITQKLEQMRRLLPVALRFIRQMEEDLARER